MNGAWMMIGVGGNYNEECVYGSNHCDHTRIRNPYLSLLYERLHDKEKESTRLYGNQ